MNKFTNNLSALGIIEELFEEIDYEILNTILLSGPIVISLVIRNTFFILEEFSQKYKEYNEENIVQFFRESVMENK